MSKDRVDPTDVMEIRFVFDEPGNPIHGWVYTIGLAKQQLPELEIREVPTFMFAAAATILNNVADYMLNEELPIGLNETMELGSKFCIFRFVKKPPIEGQEAFYTNERWCLVEPGGLGSLCNECQGAMESHMCGDKPEAEMSEMEKTEAIFFTALEEKVSEESLKAISLWKHGTVTALHKVLAMRLSECGFIDERTGITFNEATLASIRNGETEALVSKYFDEWEYKEYFVVVDLLKGQSVEAKARALEEMFGKSSNRESN